MVKALNTLAAYLLGQAGRLSSTQCTVTPQDLKANLEFMHALHFYGDGTPCLGLQPQASIICPTSAKPAAAQPQYIPR